jgi:membrane-associated phospholipid phosphatase
MISAQALIWSVLAAMGVADVFLFAAQRMTISMRWMPLIVVIVLCGASYAMRRRNPPVGRLLTTLAQISVFTYIGALLTYAAMAASPFPMADALLSKADAVLGFDWQAWFAWVNAKPAVHFILAAAYASCPLQLLGLMTYFTYDADSKRIDEMLLAGILSIIIITPIMVLVPAVGAWSHYGVGIEPWRADILALRAHTLLTIDKTGGIVSFPSFHTVLGVLFADMARGRKWFLPLLILNLLLIASVMTEGAHYAVDMLSGLLVAWASLAASRTILKSQSVLTESN